VPGSAPRKTLLKTRIVKKELGPTWKRTVSRFDPFVAGAHGFSRLKSRSIATVPFATISFSSVPVWLSASCVAEFPELLPKSKSSGSVK
jgi:hypothetical protein